MSRAPRLVKKKKSKVVHIYQKPQHDEVYKKIAKVLEREGRSFSDLVWELVSNYARAHEPGNPQQLLPRFSAPNNAYRANTCERCGKLVSELYECRFISGWIGKVCEKCVKQTKDNRTLIKKLRRIKCKLRG